MFLLLSSETAGKAAEHVEQAPIVVRLVNQYFGQAAYDFEMKYRLGPHQDATLKFYMVPLGAYFKPRRQTQSRETILREYAADALEIFQKVLPPDCIFVAG